MALPMVLMALDHLLPAFALRPSAHLGASASSASTDSMSIILLCTFATSFRRITTARPFVTSSVPHRALGKSFGSPWVGKIRPGRTCAGEVQKRSPSRVTTHRAALSRWHT